MKIKERLLQRKLKLKLITIDKHDHNSCIEVDKFIYSQLIKNNSNTTDNNLKENNEFRKWLFLKNNFSFAVSAMHLDKNNRIVSNVSLFPCNSWDGESQKLSGQLADTFTNKNFQGLGLFDEAVIAAINKISNKNHNIVYGFPNQFSLPGYINRMNFGKVDNGLITQIKRVSSVSILLKLLPKPSNKILKLLDKVDPIKRILSSQLYLQKKNKNTLFRQTLKIGKEFDDIWVSSNKGIKFLNARDSKFLNWRYLKNKNKFKLYKIIHHQIFSGYIVTLEINDYEKDDLKNLWLVDWFYDAKNKDIFESQIIRFLNRLAVKCKADNIIIQQSQFSPLSIESTFKKIGKKRNLVIYKNNEGKKFLERSNPWHFTLGDTDHF
jgi:hypothetical protein